MRRTPTPPSPPARPPGRFWRYLLLAAILGLVAAGAPLIWLYGQVRSGMLERELSAVLTDLLGRKVTVGAITMGWSGGLYLDRLGVAGHEGEAPLFLLGQIRVDYSYWKLFTGELALDSVTFVRPSLRLVRRPDGSLNCSDVLAHLATRKPAAAEPAPAGPPKVAVPASPEDVPASPVRRVQFDNVDILLEDQTVKPAAVQELRDFQLDVHMPGPNKPLVASLSGHPGTAHVRFDANLYMAPLLGRIEFSAKGLSFSGLEPYLAKLPVKLQDPRLEAGVAGWLDIPEGFLTVEKGKPRIDPALLRYGADLDVKSLRAKLPGGEVAARLLAHVVTGSAKLEELSVLLGDTTLLKVTGSLDDFTSPSFDLRADIPELPVEKLLAFVPRDMLPGEALQALSRVEPQGKLSGIFRAVGTPARPLLSGELAARDLAFVLPLCTLDVNLEKLVLSPERVELRGLELKALGARAALSAIVDGVSSLPSFSLALDARSPELGELPLPVPVAEATGRIGLSVRAGAATAKLAAANHATDLRALTRRAALAGFEPLQAVLSELKSEGARLRGAMAGVDPRAFLKPGPGMKPADRVDWKGIDALRQKADLGRLETLLYEKLPRALASARDLLEARLHAEVTLEGLHAKPGSVPIDVKGGLVADLDQGLRTRELQIAAGGIPVGLELALEKPLQAPALKAALALAPGTGTVSLASLAALAPPTAQARIQALELDPAARAGFAVTAHVSRPESRSGGPGFTAELFADRVALGHAPLRVEVPAFRLNANERGIEMPRTTVRFGPLALILELAATRADGARLLLRTADGAGLDLSSLAVMLPPGTRERLEPLLKGGRLGAEVTAAATMEDASAQVRVRAHHPLVELGFAAKGEDLLGKGKLDSLLRFSVPKLASLTALLPTTVATRAAPFDLTKSSVDLRLTAKGDLAKLVLGGQARFPGGETQITGEASPFSPTGRAWVSAATRVSRLGEILSILPQEVRSKIDKLRPEADLRLGLNLAVEKGRQAVEQTVELATARAVVTTQGMEIPIDLSGTRGAARAIVLSGHKPVIDADFSGLKARTTVRGVPIAVTSQGGFHMETTSARLLGAAVNVNGNPIRLEMTIADPWAERKAEASAVLDHWQLGPWVAAFVPREKSVVVTGTASVGVQAAGRFPFLEGFLWVELAGVHADAPQLKGLGAGIPMWRMKFTRDDVIVDNADILFGVKRFHLPIVGSMKKILNVPNVYLVDPKAVGPLLLTRMGGVEGIKSMMGEKQIERLILDQTMKVIVWVKARDYPDTFLFKNVMPPEDKARFWQQPQQVVDKHVELAKQALAEKMGFPKRTYGEKNYRMIQINFAKARVLDEQLNSIWPEFIPFWRLTTTPSDW